jgi:hypothetical protein
MGGDKKLVLTGCALFTVESFYVLWRFVLTLLDSLSPQTNSYPVGDWTWLSMIGWFLISPLVVAFLILNCLAWVAFARLDKNLVRSGMSSLSSSARLPVWHFLSSV